MSDFLNRISHYSAKRLALLSDELLSRVQELERARDEPIAIVGIGCRFPGGARSPEQLWQLTRAGVDAITEVPSDRWNVNSLYDPNPDTPGKMSTRWGGFIDRADEFDPHFFGISPREAQSMDPQQRVVLEVTWEALEHAGISPQRLEGTHTSVYLGVSAADYYQLIRAGGVANLDPYTASGVAHSIASGRLSYFLGTRGPSVSIDTACSSSLVAIHHAVNSLRQGESSMALAGGVNLVLGPEITIALSKSRMMAPDGRCKVFDSRADGFVRSEGCGMLVLKRLRDAQADGDRIVAVIRGAAANHDGRSNGLTAPNGPSQEAVLREALANAGVQPHEVGFVEAHGTGTSLGDPIEVQALGAVLGAQRAGRGPLLVGSVKANIGHLEASAGVAGLIKLAMALKHGEIPAQIHIQKPNPHIAWDELAVRAPTSLTPWPSTNGGRRIGGVSSFGFSGTNVHMLLEQAPQPPADTAAATAPERHAHVIALSARSEAALTTLAASYAKRLRASEDSLASVAFTLNAGRAHFAHRAAFMARSKADALGALERLADGDTDVAAAGVARGRAPRIAFLFTGQGSQYAGMARGLFESEPQFRATLKRCNELLRPYFPRPLLSVLYPKPGDASPIDDTEYTQQALFCIEYALATLWMSWGVRPAMVLGHSVGEVVAACVAGVFSLEDALRLVASRGKLMGALPRNGGMVSVLATQAQVTEALAPWRAEVGIAAVNGPKNIVISGLLSSLKLATARLTAAGMKCTELNVSHAFHSPLMQPMLADFKRTLASIAFSPPRCDLVSTVTGRPIGAEVASAAYWSDQVQAAVQFEPAVQSVAKAGCDVFLEVGPQPTLLSMARQCVSNDGIVWLPSLRRGKDDWAQMLESLAALYAQGVDIDWLAFDFAHRHLRVTLPGYPFHRERFWVSSPAVTPDVEMPAPPSVHPLLGREVLQSISAARLFESRFDLARLAYLEDLRIRGSILLPPLAFAEMLLAAAAQQFGAGSLQLAEFTVNRALPVEGDAPVTVQIAIDAPIQGECKIRILSRGNSERRWILHATGRVSVGALAAAQEDLNAIRSRITGTVDVSAYYEWLSSLGLEFGPRFRAVDSISRRDGEVLARMQVPQTIESEMASYVLHPAALDACLHLIGTALPAGIGLRDAFMLVNAERIRVHGRLGSRFWAHVTLDAQALRASERLKTLRANMRLLDDSGALVAEFLGLRLKRARLESFGASPVSSRVRGMIHEIIWREAGPAGMQLPSPQSIARRMTPRLAQLAAANSLGAYASFIPGLDALARVYVVRALKALGLGFAPGERFDGEALRKRLGILDKYQRLFARMLTMLAEDGVLIVKDGQWCTLREPPDVSPDALCNELLVQHADCSAEVSLTRRCGESLARVLCGQADPLSLLFPESSLAETESLYQNSPPSKTYNGLIAAVFADCQAGAPFDRPLRILEIGAGTGSTTSYIVKELQDLTAAGIEYTFTDVSPLFLKRAAEKFGSPSYMRFKLLDIGRDPAAQGFEPGRFDIVVAANVLHATPDLGITLANVSGLMRPGGLLVLLEGATAQRFGDLTVGLLEGWWAYSDTHRRNYALMQREPWLKLLRERGFVDAVAVPGESSGPVLSQQAVYIAQAPAQEARAPSRFVVVPDRQGFALAVAQSLRAGGDTVDLISAQNASSLAANLCTALATPCHGVLFLPALDIAVWDGMPADTVLAGQQNLLSAALAAVQTIGSGASNSPRLWLVTRGAQAIDAGESANPAQATLWGFSHVVALERPELSCTRVDLDISASMHASVAALVAELRDAGLEDQIALRGEQRLVRRLAHHKPRAQGEAAVAIPISTSKCYLITGGLRGLGLRVAEWLADRGARHIVLMGRAAPDALAQQTIERLEARGVKIVVVRGDIGLRKDVERVIESIAASGSTLGGIIHAAGVLDDGVLNSQSWPRFAAVMSPKVTGTWLLHTLACDLDFLVLFSSGASLAGSAGQANHAAANAFVDALAWYRQARGLPTVSINWGPWADIGAAADRQVGATGLRPIEAVDGLAALGYAMCGQGAGVPFPSTQLAVFPTDWSHLVDGGNSGRVAPLFAELAAEAARNSPKTADEAARRSAVPSLRERMMAATPNRRKTVLRDFVRQQTANVLGVQRAEDLDENEPLRQLGLDSLMAVQLRNVLGKAVHRTLPATVTFDNPCLAALVEFLCAEVFAAELGEFARETPQSLAASDGGLESMTEDELALQLAARLEGIASGERL